MADRAPAPFGGAPELAPPEPASIQPAPGASGRGEVWRWGGTFGFLKPDGVTMPRGTSFRFDASALVGVRPEDMTVGIPVEFTLAEDG